jgi:uroporphyrinogen-III synthase
MTNIADSFNISARDDSLEGLRVLITRPQGRGENLAGYIQRRGGEVLCFPVIDITPPSSFTGMDKILADVDQYDLVEKELSLGSVPVAVVGSKTAEACQDFGIKVTYCAGADAGLSANSAPNSEMSSAMNSEGLLRELELFEKTGKKIAIFRGQDGRECLGSGLERGGAAVEYIESYRRSLTRQSFGPVVERWKKKPFNVVVITSVSILQGLRTLLGEDNAYLLKNSTVLTISERIAEACRENGFHKLVMANGPADGEIESALKTILKQ